MNELVDPGTLGTAATLGVVITIIGRGIKLLPSIPDWIIPWVSMVLGAVGYPFMQRAWTADTIIGGIVVGATVVGLYSTGKQTLVVRVEDKGQTVSPAVRAIFGAATQDVQPPQPQPQPDPNKQ